MQHTIFATAEELFHGDISAEADLAVTFDMQPAEPQTRNYPGCPSTVEQVGWSVERYCLYDDNGDPIEEGPQATTPKWLLREIDGWISDNEELLIDQACEEGAEREEDWRY